MEAKKAILVGASGLVGSHLLNQILKDERFAGVDLFGRRKTEIKHPKIKEHLIDFKQPGQWEEMIRGDVLFLCLGTTRAKAGGKQSQYTVDHTYQFEVAKAAAKNKVNTLVLVSSAGARERSPFFYIRMKAELERDIRGLSFEKTIFIRPGSLMGKRAEKRYAENIGIALMRVLNIVGIARKYKPIHASTVARAMINATFDEHEGVRIYELDALFKLAALRAPSLLM